MPTKDELTAQLAEAKAKIAELEEQAVPQERIVPEDVEFGQLYIAGEDGFRPYDDEDNTGGDTVTMALSDLQRVTAERDEARQALAKVRGQLNDAQSLHGSIDSLKPVV